MQTRCRFILCFVATSLALILATSNSVCGQINQADWPAGVESRDELATDRSYSYDFSAISVSTLQSWLARIGVQLPVDLDGDLSGWVWVQRSKDGWLDFSNYRVEGEIRSPELKIDKWSLAEAELRFGFDRGNWYVGKLAGVLQSPADQTKIGVASANAKILTATTKLIEVNVKIDQVDLNSLLQAFGLDLGIQNSGGSVDVSGNVPIASPSDLSKWSAETTLKLEDVVVPWIMSPGAAIAAVEIVEGSWDLTQGRIRVAEQELTLAATGRLDAGLPFEVTLSGRDIETSQLFRQLKSEELAAQLTGTIQLNATATGSQTKGIENATAIVQSERVTLRSRPVEQLRLRAGYTSAGVRFDIDSVNLAGGVINGSASWLDIKRLVRGIPSTAKLEISGLDLEALTGLDLPVKIRGRATGKVEFAAQTRERLDDWSSTGNLRIDSLEAAGTKFGAAELNWNKVLDSSELTGLLTASQGKGSLQTRINATLANRSDSALRSTELVNYRAEGELQEYDVYARLGDQRSTIIPIRGVGRFDVSGSPENWLQHGTAQLSNSLAMWGERLLQLEMADLSFSLDEFRLERFRLLDPNGRIAGSAILRRDRMGEHLLRMRISGVELKPYLDPFVPSQLQSLDGTMAIELELKKDATAGSLTEDWNGQWTGSLANLSFKGKPIGELEITGKIDDRIVSANVDGQLFGGVATASVRLPLSIVDNQTHPSPEPAKLQVQLLNLQAKSLAAAILERKFVAEINGQASVKLSAEGRNSNDLVVTTEIELPMVMRRQVVLARGFKAQLRYTENKLLIDRFSGGIAGGRIDARGQLQFGDEKSRTKISAGKINFALRRLDVESLVAILNPKYSEYFAGDLNYEGAATFYRDIQLRGIATVKKANLLGFPIQVARGAVRAEFSPEFEFLRLVSNDLHGTALGGKLEAEVQVNGGSQLSLKTSGQIANGKLEQIGRALGFSQIIGSGTFDGSFDLQSRQIESLSAINGGLRIDFESGDVQSIPIISSLSRLVPLAQFASTDIENGRLDARLGQGQLRINDLILNSKAFVLLASGSASLEGQKLDIDAVLQTGGGVQQRATQTALELMLVSSAPQVVAITEINELIRNRSIFVHVGGSPSRPVIQAKAGQIAAKAFLQNFSRGTLGLSTPQLIEK